MRLLFKRAIGNALILFSKPLDQGLLHPSWKVSDQVYMAGARAALLMLAILSGFIPNASARPCSTHFADIARTLKTFLSRSTEPVTNSVAVLWFPKTRDGFTTTNIENDGGYFGTLTYFERKGSVTALARRERSRNEGHFRVGIRATEEEVKKLTDVLASSPPRVA